MKNNSPFSRREGRALGTMNGGNRLHYKIYYDHTEVSSRTPAPEYSTLVLSCSVARVALLVYPFIVRIMSSRLLRKQIKSIENDSQLVAPNRSQEQKFAKSQVPKQEKKPTKEELVKSRIRKLLALDELGTEGPSQRVAVAKLNEVANSSKKSLQIASRQARGASRTSSSSSEVGKILPTANKKKIKKERGRQMAERIARKLKLRMKEGKKT